MSTAFHVRPLIDRLARVVITVGGLATILSILGIFFFLFREVTPLFSAPTAKLTQRMLVPSSLTAKGPVQLAVDEHREIAQILTSGGVQFIELASGQPISTELPVDLKGRQFRHGPWRRQCPRYAVDAEGEVLLLKIGTTTDFSSSGARQKRPMIRTSRPFMLTKGPITTLAYRFNDRGSVVALLSQEGRLIVVRLPSDEAAGIDPVITELTKPSGAVTSLALDGSVENLYIGTAEGVVMHVSLSDAEPPIVKGAYAVTEPTTAVTALGFLNGDRSLVVMTAKGEVSTWGLIRHAEDPSRWRLTKTHTSGLMPPR